MSRNGNLEPSGVAESGEVEDYQVEIVASEEPPGIEIRDIAVSEGKFFMIFDHVNNKLQHADSVSGPWDDMEEATSPFVVFLEGEQGYFRLAPR